MKIDKNMDCLLCGKNAALREASFPGYQEPEHFGIYYCASCDTSFSYPRVVDTQHVYELIYKHADKLPGYNRYVKYANVVKAHKNPLQYLSESEEMYWGVKQTLEQIPSPKKTLKIIEIGCGLGYLTYSLVQDGYCAVGLDISQNAIDEATKNFGHHYICADIMEYAVQHQGAYDVVILTEVIEHIENPIKFLKCAMLLISNKIMGGGKILLTAPNKTIYDKSIVWATASPPVHLWWFSEASMKYIAGSLNADIRFVDFSNYYKRKPKFVKNVKTPRSSQAVNHIFDKNGEITRETIRETAQNRAKKLSRKLRYLITKLPFAKYIYSKIVKQNYLCEKKGGVLGVELTIKPQDVDTTQARY
ncbi:MAG: methyltransferase domain-containing protein [Prevotellaceae bacterium]|jgi:2-polyprenyl-3-methyl-5-hydroxy-6-metoxy-1,4-benzoquinol methylase|nr:methyltransferase domain-containing protein [Prevotellaceae bacterium]